MKILKLLSLVCLVNAVQLAALAQTCDTKQHMRECLQERVTKRYQLTDPEAQELDECMNRLDAFDSLQKALNNEGKWEELLNNPSMLKTIQASSTCQNLLNKIQNQFAIEKKRRKKLKQRILRRRAAEKAQERAL